MKVVAPCPPKPAGLAPLRDSFFPLPRSARRAAALFLRAPGLSVAVPPAGFATRRLEIAIV